MASHRADKSGIAREAQDKINSKYDPEFASSVLQWVQQNSGEAFSTDGSMDNLYNVLQDGYILGKLASQLGSRKVTKNLLSKRQTMTFKKMELIGQFIESAKELGVQDHDVFQTVDLHDRANLNQVVMCLDALGRKMGTFGVKEATKSERVFTQEQLNAGKNVISLQYGSNKGASQAGQNFGRPRHIVEPEPRN